jgi:hypothetical protein
LGKAVWGRSLSPAGTKGRLVVKLEAALAHLNAGNFKAACAKLKDFITEVQNLATKKGLSLSEAQAFIDDATRIRAAAGCA